MTPVRTSALTASPRAAASPAGALGVDAWAALPQDIPGELVGGYLVEEEVADPIHELAVTWLAALLRAWLLGRGGFVFGSDVKLALSPDLGRKADLAIYLPGGARLPRRGALHAPPDIAVEVVSPSPRDQRRDRIEKMSEYAAFGVRYYWLLDPAIGALEIFALDAERRYSRVVGTTGGVIEDVPGCPGLALSLDDLWADLARLGPDGEPEPEHP